MENSSINSTNNPPSYQLIQFIFLLIIEIISIICTFFLLIYIFIYRQIMINKALRNHAILLLIFISFFYILFDLPFTIKSYYYGYDYPRTLSFCSWWYWIDYTLTAISLYLVATASIQRYFLLFKTHLLRIRTIRWLIHYIPLIFCIIYPPIFYFIVIAFYPCHEVYYDDSDYCLSPCYFENKLLLNIDWIINCVVPLVIIILNIGVLIGWLIHSMWNLDTKQLLMWKRQKKLILQLLAFSLLYVIGWAPSTCVSVLSTFSLSTFDENAPLIIFLYYMSYFICPLQPLICLFILPEPIDFIRNKVKELFPRSTVTPFVTNVS